MVAIDDDYQEPYEGECRVCKDCANSEDEDIPARKEMHNEIS